jgi:hypothetical protein
MKFRYYIVDTTYGEVKGTNDIEIAEDLSASEDFYVIDVEVNQQIVINTVGERFDIKEFRVG